MIFRIDCDYPYRSRLLSFLSVFTGKYLTALYLENAKEIAAMINESSVRVRVFWFFTVRTLPDEQMLELLNRSFHEIGLHVVSHASSELGVLEAATGRKIRYYTVHGAVGINRLLWHKFNSPNYAAPSLTGFDDAYGSPFWLDYWARRLPPQAICKHIRNCTHPIYFHPVWLDQNGTVNPRGSYRKVLEMLLEANLIEN